MTKLKDIISLDSQCEDQHSIFRPRITCQSLHLDETSGIPFDNDKNVQLPRS